MGSDITEQIIRGFGIPWPLTSENLWPVQKSYTEQGPTVGQAKPQQVSSLSLQTSGTQSSDKELRVKVSRGGQTGPDGCEVIYQYEGDAADQWRGYDQQTISGIKVIRHSLESLTTSVSSPDSTRFFALDRRDRIAVVYQRRTTGTTYIVECAVFDPDADTWSTATIYTQGSTTTGFHPCIAWSPDDGYLYCCHWVFDTANELAQIASYRSRDGSTWTEIAGHALDNGLSTSSSSGYQVGRLRMAFGSNGQLLLVGSVKGIVSGTTPRNHCAQFASISRATRFQTVEVAPLVLLGAVKAAFVAHSVAVVNGRLTVFFPYGSPAVGVVPAFGVLCIVPLPSAFATMTSRSLVLVDPSNPYLTFDFNPTPLTSYSADNSDQSVWVTEDGTVFAATRQPEVDDGLAPGVVLHFNTAEDVQSNWSACGTGTAAPTSADAMVVNMGRGGGSSPVELTEFVGVSNRGRQVLAGISTPPSSSATGLYALFLGGGSNLLLPARLAYPGLANRSGWTVSYLPFELPQNMVTPLSGATKPVTLTTATTGTASDAIGSDGLLARVTTSGTMISTWPAVAGLIVSTIAEGLIVRYALTMIAGGSLTAEESCLKLVSGDNSSTVYGVTVRFSMTGFRMWDDQASSSNQISTDKTTVAPSSGIEVLVAVSSGKFSCWYRSIDTKSDRIWTTAVENHSLTNGGGAAQNSVTWGVNSSSSTSLKIHEAHCMYGPPTSESLGAGFSNPAELIGRNVGRRGYFSAIDDGVLITAIDGSGMTGDEYDIDAAAEHPISRIFHSESPSPRSTWRSIAVSLLVDQRIPVVLNKDLFFVGTEEQGFGSSLCYLALKGCNFQHCRLQRFDTGSAAWVDVVTIDTGITTPLMLRRGTEVVATTTSSTGTSRYFYENECAGWTMKLSSSVFRKIRGNTAGNISRKSSGSTFKPATFFLEGIVGGEPSVPTAMTLIPTSFAQTFHMGIETGSAFALTIDSQRTVDGDYRIGLFSLGRMFVFGESYELGRIILHESGDRTDDSPSGVRRSRSIGPGGDTLRLAWTEPIDTSQVQGDSTLPDYIISTSSANNDPVAVRADTPFSLIGLLERVGASVAICYFPRIDVSSGSSDEQLFNRRHDHMIGQISSGVQVESVLGTELDSTVGEALRIATMTIDEVR